MATLLAKSLRSFQILPKHHCLLKSFVNNQTARCLSDQHNFDVVISGGGMVGAAMAAALAYEPILEGQRILLLEAGQQNGHTKTPSALYSSRVCALSPGTVNLLSDFGAWQNVCNVRYREVKRMQVWESCSHSAITFNKDQLTDNLAYIVENDVILSGIMKQVEEVPDRIQVQYNSRVKNYLLDGKGPSDQPQIELENGDVLSTKLLIGADGFRSLLRQTAGFHTVQWDYKQSAVVATLRLAEGVDNNTAWQRFTKTGPVALLPLSDEYSCLIWTTTSSDAKNLLKLPPESFVDAVNNAFWSDADIDATADSLSQTFDNILTTLGLEGSSSRQLPPTVIDVADNSRGMFPLGLCHSSQYVQSRLALIGDAAHRVHPLAGQGVNLGFGDVRSLRDKISNSVYNGQEIGSLSALLDYERERQLHVVPTLATIDGLNKLYCRDWTPLVVMRSLGTQATNAIRPLKDRLMTHATS